MAKEKKKVPQSITEFYRRSDQVDNIVDTTKRSHSKVYEVARQKLEARAGKKGLQALEDAGHQDFFIDALIDGYLNEIKQNEKIDIPKDKFEQDVMIQRYMGTTRTQIARNVRKHKSKYSINQHEKIRDGLTSKQKQALSAARLSHMSKGDLEDILKHTGTGKMFDKDRLSLEHGAILLDSYRETGEFNYSSIDQIKAATEGQLDLGDYLTAAGKKAHKSMKDKYKEAK